LGILKELPRSVEQAYQLLEEDLHIQTELGEDLVKMYLGLMKKYCDLLASMESEETQRLWLIERF